MNTEDSEFERIEAEAKRRAMAEEDDDTQTYTSESADAYSYRCGYEAGAAAIKEALAQPEQPKVRTGDCLLVGVCASEGHKIQPQLKPLSEEEIQTYRHMIDWTAEWSYINFARAIEAAHGIKGEA